ncbi:restriction endonuclease subunit S [Aliarcobacter butzleri]|uniref:restriction endonuclease subunit S n=1 Tax=Aliarcobacter butzleri TaxID=28197 RepID=UPI0024DE6E2C|nr:restriction endonuclease subunit S [Aliarcobacter butzleri]MDK2070606.1 restriction endonuclease subunit S [Aliarcobacter butzleri]
MSAIKKGYKQTKVGIIPDYWEVVSLNDGVSFLDHKRKPLKDEDRQKIQGQYPYYGASGIIDYVNDYIFDEELILIGEDGANIIDRSSRLVFLANGKYWVNNHAHVLKSKQNFNNYFLCEYLESLKYDKYNTGTAQPKLNKEIVSNIPIIKPPLKEQEKIAEILTTWDEAITKQTELLRAKELQKKALMQKLLSGEVRFSGFSDEWKEVRIKDIFEITRGYVLAVTEMSQEQTTEYKYPVYSSQTKNNGLTGYYKDYLFENCITWTTDGANAGDVNLRKGKFYCTNVCGVLKSDKGYANQCIAEILNLVTKNYVSYVGNPKLMNNTMGGIKIKIPKSLPEQQKIAEVLSLADDETNLLKNELEELKQQKKALMQKLLTGEVRVKV